MNENGKVGEGRETQRERDRTRQREKRCSNYDRQTEAGKNLEKEQYNKEDK